MRYCYLVSPLVALGTVLLNPALARAEPADGLPKTTANESLPGEPSAASQPQPADADTPLSSHTQPDSVKPKSEEPAQAALKPAAVATPSPDSSASLPDVPGADATHRPDQGVVNLLGPVHLQWLASADFGLPGLGGFRLGASFYLPWLPVMVAGQFSQYWGKSPSHDAGSKASLFEREMTPNRTLEARAGAVISSWSLEEQEGQFDYNYRATDNPNVKSFTRDSYAVALPTRHQFAIYAGYRARGPFGSTACPTDRSLPADCAETKQSFLLVGFDWLTAFDANLNTRDHGWLHHAHQRNVDFHLMYSPTKDDYARDSFVKRVGAEITVIQRGKWFAFTYGFGWDGQNALLTLGMGAGQSHSLVGRAPTVSEIH